MSGHFFLFLTWGNLSTRELCQRGFSILDFKRHLSPKIWVFFLLANGTLSWGPRWPEWWRNDQTCNFWLNHCLIWHVAGHLGLYRSKFGLKTTKLQLFLSRTLTHLNRSQSCLIEAFAKGLVEPRLHLRLGLTQCALRKNTWQAIWVFTDSESGQKQRTYSFFRLKPWYISSYPSPVWSRPLSRA